MIRPDSIRTCLWFDDQGENAAKLYVSLFPDSRIDAIHRPDPDGPALIVDFTLAGVPYQALNGGPHYELTPAASISVLTENQADTDRLWDALIDGGGSEQPCGWLTDRFGLSWQVVPKALPAMLASTDRDASARVFDAMMQMKRLDLAALEAAFRGESKKGA